ncbi:MAG: KamA family radical SAM protein [Desulfamplus sp.]|nr:KamA family radical SAM protein [Desulfamplus sp.]
MVNLNKIDYTNRWQDELKNSIFNLSELKGYLSKKSISTNLLHYLDTSGIGRDIDKVTQKYPMRITPYYLDLVKSVQDPIWRQAMPDPLELSYESASSKSNYDNINLSSDPLHEERQSPVSSIIHRYPDRVIFLVSNQCAMYCRYCMRKRKVGGSIDNQKSHINIKQGLNYIKENRAIRDVILSGGDPLLLSTESLDKILFALRQIEHVETIRIHTRVICTLPYRITENLASTLEKYHPLYINTHFNHPSEITDKAAAAADKLAHAGIPLGCQTVLLKGVNDNPETMIDLMRGLIKIRIKPYYLHHPDPVISTTHFRPSLEIGLDIMRAMRGNLTGIAVPQYMVDLPGGYGKLPILPDYIKKRDADSMVVENYQGKICKYWF